MDAEAEILTGIHVIALIGGATVAWHVSRHLIFVLTDLLLSLEVLSPTRFSLVYEIIDQPEIFEVYKQEFGLDISYEEFLRSHMEHREEARIKFMKSLGQNLVYESIPALLWLVPMAIVFSYSQFWLLMGFIAGIGYLLAVHIYNNFRQSYQWRNYLPLNLIVHIGIYWNKS